MATQTEAKSVDAVLLPKGDFEGLPPFPTDVPIAPLLRLSLDKLLSRDAEELKRFFSSCEDLGFFYLDLTTCSEGQSLLDDADKLFRVGEELFDIPLEEKKTYDFTKSHNSYFGYKGFGANVVDRQGNMDRNEYYNASKDHILGHGTQWPQPKVLDENRELMQHFVKGSHAIVLLVLELLNEYLNQPAGTLQSMHRLDGLSGDHIRFIKTPPQPVDDRRTALGEHSDFGSVTVLFNRLGGLQILPPGKDAQWCYVKPLPGHAIINLGDSMVKFTNGLLRSNIHRVHSPPGAQAETTRYSLVYFNRPEEDVILRRLDGCDKIPSLGKDEVEDKVRAGDWVFRRMLGKRLALYGEKAYDLDSWEGSESQSRRGGTLIT